MALYAIKKDDGTLVDTCGDTANETLERGVYFEAEPNKSDAERYARQVGGHVVELIEKPEPVAVSEEEAEILEQAKKKDTPAWIISTNSTNADEDRLMRAYVNGWEVEKPKRYLIKVPHTTDELYWKRGNGNIGCAGAWQNDDEIVRSRAFTLAEIEHYGLGECERVEVTNDEQ